MNHLRFVVVVLGILWAASCSSTSNQTTTPQPSRETDRFAVSTEDGSGTFTPALNVQESGNTTTVTVKVQEAADLSEAYLHLNYDATQYTPTEVKFGDFLGAQDQLVTLALTEKAGDVQIGAAQILNGGAVPQDGAGVLATVTFQQTPFTGTRNSSAFPEGAANAVTDLKIKSQVGSDVTLEWTERNKGDYNNNGIVGISDLSPIALYIGQSVASTSDPLHAAMIDGDQNGEVTISDLGPIGGNLDNHVTGYNVYSNAAGTTMVNTVARPDNASINPKRPVVYTLQLTASGSEEFTVRPVGSTSGETGTESNVAAPQASEPGEPQAPSSLVATNNDQAVGSMKIKLTWTASTSSDINLYAVERKLSTDPDSSFAEIVQVPGNLTQYTDQTGLTDADYDYRVWSIDTESLTSLASSNVATGNPYVTVIESPANLTAVTGSGPAGVDLDWDDVTDPNVFHYRIYRKGPGEPNFTAVTTVPKVQGSSYADNGLTEHENYEYYVTSLDFGQTGESTASNTASASASDALILQIVSLTTDKTTHHTGGAEQASNITAVANTPLATWVWSSTLNDVTGTGDSVTWKPSGNPSPQKVTITATAQFGAQSVSQDLDFYLTSESIKTSFGDNGKFIEWTGSSSVLQPTAPFRPLSYYVGNGDKVVLYDSWGIWCYWCKRGFPNIRMMTEAYPDFQYVGENNSGESTAMVTDYFESPTFTGENPPHPGMNLQGWESYQGSDPNWGTAYGRSGYPSAIVFDRDGYIRLQHSGAILDGLPYGPEDLSKLVSELTGQSPHFTTTWDAF